MSAIRAPRCGKPMRGQKICGRPALHNSPCLSEEAYRRQIAESSERKRDGRYQVQVHGYGSYTSGCRCGICTAAKTGHMAAQRAEAVRKAKPGVAVQGVTHATRVAYKDKGCRCEKCVDFMRDYWRQESADRRAVA